ncbi:MAG: hypothetical protein GTO14_13045 [Anaerolineales bacterium]|nr:hypothetical protein [Anaerolineales bacterium]
MRTQDWEDRWDFDADLLPLDFANTAEWHAGPEPTERLNSYSDLVGWSRAAGLLTETEAGSLLDKAAKDTSEATRTLARAIDVREAIYDIFSALAAHRELPEGALDTINTALSEALEHARITPADEAFTWAWSGEGRLDRMLWPILHATAELLTSDDLERVGECADNRGCGYLFFDTSRNHSRRWCSMEACGNRAKAQRHYSRKVAQEPVTS